MIHLVCRLATASIILCAAVVAPAQVGGKTASSSVMPRVVLLGDSIRMGYAPCVTRLLSGKALVVSPEPNGGDSANLLANLAEWVISQNPDLVHFNAGLHDLKVSKQERRHQVPIDRYESNLRQLVERVRGATSATLVFASTTPILDERHAQRGADFDRSESDVRQYNSVAARVMEDLGVPINDLHWIVERRGTAELLAKDGTHYTPGGYETLGRAVADCVLRHLTIRRYRALPAAPAGPEAAEAYRRVEAERDSRVPESFKNTRIPDFVLPDGPDAWSRTRPAVFKTVVTSLGDLPPRPTKPAIRIVARELWREFSVERVSIPNGVDGEVTALLLMPEKVRKPAPAILWLHSSTPDKNQILIPNTNGGPESLGEAFTRAGYVVLSPDAYWHGDRAGTGPAGALETLREEQESLFKFHFWFGRTLWGMFVRDDQIALDYLASRPEVDRLRIGATGMSMGSTRAWWLAAIDERVAATVGVACLTRYRNLIAHGQLRQHGIYYFVNGLLKHFDTEGVISLIAPRPYLALTGDLDAGSPVDGIRVIEEEVGTLYRRLGAPERFRSVVYPNVGHSYTPEMRAEMLAWFARWLRPQGE